MNFLPNLEDNTFLVVTLARTSASVALPQNISLSVLACGTPTTIVTKAQTETRENSNFNNFFSHDLF